MKIRLYLLILIILRLKGLSNEVTLKLNELKPESIGQASRVSGITPAAISILLIHLKKSGIRRKAG